MWGKWNDSESKNKNKPNKIVKSVVVRLHPDDDDGNEADRYEEDVQAEQQAVYDETHLDPLLGTLAPAQMLFHPEAETLELLTQAPQLVQGLVLI